MLIFIRFQNTSCLRIEISSVQRWSDSRFLLSDPILFLKNDIRIRYEFCFAGIVVPLLRSESLSGKCAKLHTVAASNNRDHKITLVVTSSHGRNFVAKCGGHRLVWNQYSHRVYAEVTFYTVYIQIHNRISRCVLRATLITLCFLLADDLHISPLMTAFLSTCWKMFFYSKLLSNMNLKTELCVIFPV